MNNNSNTCASRFENRSLEIATLLVSIALLLLTFAPKSNIQGYCIAVHRAPRRILSFN